MSELKQVKASAGSGKTYQLTRRFLDLLDRADATTPFTCTASPHRGYAWPEIMAVTFTNKAASEMKERVVAALKHTALGTGKGPETSCSPETAARALDSVLRRYHRLNIRTIDSLLALLLRLFALETGIRPDFQMIFDEKELFKEVCDRFMDRCETDGEAQDMLSAAMDTLIRDEGRGGFWIQDRIRDRLLALLRFLRSHPVPLLTDQERIRELLTAEYANFTALVRDMETFLETTGLPVSAHFQKYLANCLDAPLFDPPPTSKMIEKETFRDCVNKAGKDRVDGEAEARYARLQLAHRDYAATHATLAGAYYLAPAIDIALRLSGELEKTQKQHGMILGSALAGFVNQRLALGEAVSEAYCRLGCRLHHLLVDEFQDTSREQWQAITPLSEECLAKGGSLYYVGDVKQAIYGWRGGDSALFDKVMTRPGLADLAREAETDTLPDNWRSFRNVVEFNNNFFRNFENPGLAADLADTLFRDAPGDFRRDFASELARSFTDCGQTLPDKHRDTEGYVRMERLPGGAGGATEEQTLEALDALLDELTPRRRFRDIAVLVRKHDHASLVCDLLSQKNIPFITEKSLQLDRHPVVRQLAGFLAFLDFPRDDVAFLTFASGPELFLAETGITEEAFHDWLIRPRKRPLGVCFREDFPDQWQRFIEPFYNQSGLMTPYDLTQEALRAFRVLDRHPDAELYVRRFLEVVHLAEENGYGSLSGFLEFWSEKSGEEKVPLPENVDAVRIMTIHKAKGLEFPVVIVPFHHWKVREDTPFAVRRVGEQRVVTPMRKALGKPYLTSLGRAVREQLNLVYVAWTRAREELYGFFTEKPNNSPALAAMNRFLDIDENTVFEYGVPPEDGPPSERVPRPVPADLPERADETELMGWLPRLRVYRHNLDEYFYNERMRGEVAHRAMELVRVTGDDAADIDRAARLALMDFPALGALHSADFERLEADVRAMLEWALGEEGLRQWLATGEREPEVMDGQGNFKRLDLLYRGEETVIADFKTGQPSPKNREQVLDYMHILRECDPGCNPLGFLIYLDLRQIHAVTEDA